MTLTEAFSSCTGAAVALAAGAFCATLTATGLLFYEDGMDSIVQTFLSDLLVDGPPVTPLATGKWLLFDRLMICFGGMFPSVDWYGLTMFILSGVIAALLIRVLGSPQVWNSGRAGAPFTFLAFGTAFLFVENLVLMQYTRVAYFICFLPMLVTFIRLRDGNRMTVMQSLMGLGCFAIGALIRMEAAALAIFMSAPLLLFARPRGLELLPTGMRLFLFPLAITAGVSALMLCPSELDDSIRLHNRFLHNADGLRFAPADLGITERSDSLAYEVTLNYFMNDPLHINEELVQRAGIMPMTSANAITKHLQGIDRFAQRLHRHVPNYVERHWGLLLFAVCCFLFAMMFPGQGVSRRGLLLLFSSYLLLAVLIAGYIKVEDRVFNPMVLTWAITALALGNRDAKGGKALGLALALAVFVSVGAEALTLRTTVVEKREDERSVNLLLNHISDREAKLVVMDIKLMGQLYQAPFRPIDLPMDRDFFSIDNGILFLYPGYEARTLRLFGTFDTGEIMTQLASCNDSCVLVSTKFRAAMMTDYFNRQHGLSLHVRTLFAADDNTDATSGNPHGLIAYVLEKD